MFRVSRIAIVAAVSTQLASCGPPTRPTTQSPSASSPPPVCRTYAAAYTTRSSGPSFESMESSSCAFGRSALTLECTHSSDGCTRRTTTTYASATDFVEEALVAGRVRGVARESVGCGGSATDVYTFDAAMRPITRRTENENGDYATTFTAWDAHGRPTRSTSDTEGCTGSTEVTTYDDAARTSTSTSESRGEGRSCFSGDSVLTVTYDVHGNVVNEVFVSDGETTYSATHTITATATVCSLSG